MAKKLETAAERYRRIKAEREANAETFEVVTPSGMVWKLRRPNITQFIQSGMIPLSFAAKMVEAVEVTNGDKQAAFEALSDKEQLQTIEFVNNVLFYCAVSPRIVMEARPGEDEISYNEVELDDYEALVAWALPGGGEAETLTPFPDK